MSAGSRFQIDSTPRGASRLRARGLCAWLVLGLVLGAVAPIHGHAHGEAHQTVLVEASEPADACSLCSLPKVQQSITEASAIRALSARPGPEGPTATPRGASDGVARAHPPRAPPALS